NMTKLESYMVDSSFSAAMFLADVEGHPDDIGLKHAFEELRFFATVDIMGVYPAAAYRQDHAGRNI
ncbi:MAG: prephenate dehydratase, partial [Hyphomicrobiales bacterium]|nr:prephenate dehydratase [Hyphomicrobiales bacterium]